jgi:hypothetical protein
MTRKSTAQKIEFLYALSERVNEVAILSARRGPGEVGHEILGIMDFVASEIGLPPDYKDRADDNRLVNEGVDALLEQYPE